MFGQQLTEITDIQVFKHGFGKLLQYKNKEKNQKWNETELEYLKELERNILIMHELYNKDFNKYVKIMKDNFDIGRYNETYDINEKVIYYIGDRDSPMRKLKHKWTGPWRAVDQIYPNTVVLKNDDNGETWDAEICRVRKYKSRGFWKLSQYEKMVKKGEINDNLQD